MSHTPEPWWVAGHQIEAKEERVADCQPTGAWLDHVEANARRAVACVNALAGWETEALEAGAVAELVAAAEAATEIARFAWVMHPTVSEEMALDRLEAALLAVKGG